jgi:hypothetical protein
LTEQLDKFSLEKMREGIESNAKTMVDAVKHELVISNLEKDIIRLKMEADLIAQAHELEEKNWKRSEAELKDRIFNLLFSTLLFVSLIVCLILAINNAHRHGIETTPSAAC